LIDDEPDVRNLLFNFLTEAFGESLLILQADNGRVAAEIINGVKVDIIISDFDMPNGSGLTVYLHLKKSKQFPKFIFFQELKTFTFIYLKWTPFFKGLY
jgi:YesN/AraC family two-component response regulator